MLEKIKAIPFIDESAAVKLYTVDGTLVMERFTRVLWAKELSAVPAEDISCYVEAAKFFPLLPFVKTLQQTTCLTLQLKNGAKYDLPFLTVEWESPEDFPTELRQIKFDLSDLMLTTLKNLVKPELQCIYIDQQGAVSCDFISACLTDKVRFDFPLLLPPDIQELVNGTTCDLGVNAEIIYVKHPKFEITSTVPTLEEEAWWEDLRHMIPQDTRYIPANTLLDSVKRLAVFGDYVTFEEGKVCSETNHEPFTLEDVLPTSLYATEYLLKVLSVSAHIAHESGNLLLKNNRSVFLVSEMGE